MEYSVVIPLKNEEGNVLPLINELEPIMKGLGKWELICVDDGSTDQTLPLLEALAKEKSFLKILSFEKNYGQSSAFDAGFRAATGEWIITLDGDRQNDPADIPKLVNAKEGCALVCGIRQKRNDPLLKRFLSLLGNGVRSRFCHDGVQDTGCSLKLYNRQALSKIKLFHGMHRFLPALFKMEGFTIGEVPVNHRPRTAGKTKYTLFNRSFNTIADMFAVRWMQSRTLHYRVKNQNPKSPHD